VIGSGVLQTAQTAAPDGFSNPQCGHSVVNGMGPACEYDTRRLNSIQFEPLVLGQKQQGKPGAWRRLGMLSAVITDFQFCW
jgi:hypothetical protein